MNMLHVIRQLFRAVEWVCPLGVWWPLLRRSASTCQRVTQSLMGNATSGSRMSVQPLSRTLYGDSSLGVFNIIGTLVVMTAVLVIAAAAPMRRAVRVQPAGTLQLQDGA